MNEKHEHETKEPLRIDRPEELDAGAASIPLPATRSSPSERAHPASSAATSPGSSGSSSRRSVLLGRADHRDRDPALRGHLRSASVSGEDDSDAGPDHSGELPHQVLRLPDAPDGDGSTG